MACNGLFFGAKPGDYSVQLRTKKSIGGIFRAFVHRRGKHRTLRRKAAQPPSEKNRNKAGGGIAAVDLVKAGIGYHIVKLLSGNALHPGGEVYISLAVGIIQLLRQNICVTF